MDNRHGLGESAFSAPRGVAGLDALRALGLGFVLHVPTQVSQVLGDT